MRKPKARRLIVNILFYICIHQYCCNKYDYDISIMKSEQALRRRDKERMSWSQFNERVTDKHFRRMFRMSRDCFDLLCCAIISRVGEKQFKSESYLDSFLRDESIKNKSSMMHNAHMHTSGGFISGEVKLAIALRMLAGGSAMDISVIFDVSESHCKTVFIKVLHDWIVKVNIGSIDIESYLKDEDAMRHVSNGFSRRSNGILCGAIGAIDGWLVKIQRPHEIRDGIKNPASFFLVKDSMH